MALNWDLCLTYYTFVYRSETTDHKTSEFGGRGELEKASADPRQAPFGHDVKVGVRSPPHNSRFPRSFSLKHPETDSLGKTNKEEQHRRGFQRVPLPLPKGGVKGNQLLG